MSVLISQVIKVFLLMAGLVLGSSAALADPDESDPPKPDMSHWLAWFDEFVQQACNEVAKGDPAATRAFET